MSNYNKKQNSLLDIINQSRATEIVHLGENNYLVAVHGDSHKYISAFIKSDSVERSDVFLGNIYVIALDKTGHYRSMDGKDIYQITRQTIATRDVDGSIKPCIIFSNTLLSSDSDLKRAVDFFNDYLSNISTLEMVKE